MTDNWLSTSEIVAGKIIKGRLSLNAVRPELFIEPYDKIIELMQKGIKEKEELISRVGFSPVSAALDAANAAETDHMDWVILLEKISAKCILAEKLRRHAKKLDNGEDVDTIEVVEDFRQLDGKKPYMTPLDEIVEETNPFMDSGWPAIDKEFCGLPKSGLITLGAGTKVGKTSWMSQLADYFAIRYPDKKVGIFTLEMLAGEYKHRLLQLSEKVEDTGEIIAMAKDRQHRIVVDDSAGMSVQEVANKAAREPNLGLVAVDFADLMVQDENSESAMAKIYLTLSSLAKSLAIPVVLLSQFSRTYVGGVPMPRHVRYTGLAEALSWMLLVLYNPAKDMAKSKDDVITLSAVPGMAYTVGWLIRGGFLKHENDNPGAIQMSFSGRKGWGRDSLGWMKLHVD